MQTTVKLNDTYGPITVIWQANNPFLLVSDREMTEFFLRSPKYITKSDIYDILDPWLGTGILASDGKSNNQIIIYYLFLTKLFIHCMFSGGVWQRKRKTITPAFHFKVLDNYISMFDAACDTLVDVLSAKADEKKCDIVPFITSFTLEIIAGMTFKY